MCCRAKEQARAELKILFDIAPFCTEAKLIEAELLLEEQDYGGVTPHSLMPEGGSNCPFRLSLVYFLSRHEQVFMLISLCGFQHALIKARTSLLAGVAIMTGQVLKADPGNLEGLVLRGRTYIHLGDLEVIN